MISDSASSSVRAWSWPWNVWKAAVKMVKPGQDERVDLPSIGLTTIRNLVSLRYAALAIHAGKTLFFDREEALALADENGLSIVALNDDFS